MADIWLCNPFDNLVEEGARPQRYALLAAELRHRGHRVVWWSSDFNHLRKDRRRDPGGAVLPDAYTSANGVEMRLLPTPPYRGNIGLGRIRSHRTFARLWGLKGLEEVRSGALSAPALIVTSLPPLGTHAIARRFRERWGSILVTDIQDAWPENFEGLMPLPSFLRHPVWKALFVSARRAARSAYRTSDALSAVGERYLALAGSYGSEVPRHLCLLGIDEVQSIPEDHPADRPLRLVYAGNMGSRAYDIATLIKAILRLRTEKAPIELDLAGAGPDENRLRALAADSPAIRFHGFLDKGSLAGLLRGCDIGVIPMFDRSLVAIPNKVADYAASGLAVLNSLTGETARLLVRYGAGGSYRAGDVDDCIGAIRSIGLDREKLDGMRRDALRMANEVFLARTIYPRFAAFLEELLAGADRPSSFP